MLFENRAVVAVVVVCVLYVVCSFRISESVEVFALESAVFGRRYNLLPTEPVTRILITYCARFGYVSQSSVKQEGGKVRNSLQQITNDAEKCSESARAKVNNP